MTDYGVSETGFTLKTYDEILSDLSASAQTYFGYSVDTSVNTPLGQFLRTTAVEIAQLWEQLEKTYYSGFINTAEGVNLDRICALVGITRNPAVKASGSVIFSIYSALTSDITIPKNTVVATEDGKIEFVTTESATLHAGETSVSASVSARYAGIDGNITSGLVTRIVSNLPRIDLVTNIDTFTGGKNKESDAELRERTILNKPSAKGTCSAIKSAVLAISGVSNCIVTEDTDNHTVKVLVVGGDEAKITSVIADVKPAGIAVDWDYASGINIDVSVTVSSISNAQSTEVVSQVETAVASWINSHKIGDALKFSSLFTKLSTLPLVSEVTSLSITDGTATADAILESVQLDYERFAHPGNITVVIS